MCRHLNHVCDWMLPLFVFHTANIRCGEIQTQHHTKLCRKRTLLLLLGAPVVWTVGRPRDPCLSVLPPLWSCSTPLCSTHTRLERLVTLDINQPPTINKVRTSFSTSVWLTDNKNTNNQREGKIRSNLLPHKADGRLSSLALQRQHLSQYKLARPRFTVYYRQDISKVMAGILWNKTFNGTFLLFSHSNTLRQMGTLRLYVDLSLH